MTANSKRFLSGLFRFVLGLSVTGGIGFAAFFAFMLVACTGGGALVIVLPVCIVVLPIYYRVMRYCFTGNIRRKQQKNIKGDIPDLSREVSTPVMEYIVDMRKLGIGEEVIIDNLTDAGWSQKDIEDARVNIARVAQAEM